MVDYHFPKDLQSVNVVLKLRMGVRGDTGRYLLQIIYLKVLIVPQKPRLPVDLESFNIADEIR